MNIQAMVFGNMGEKCATGVAFTRNPATGLTSGHQGCVGCVMVTGTNQVLRALKLMGKHVVASIGTGCNEVITTQNTSCWGDVSKGGGAKAAEKMGS